VYQTFGEIAAVAEVEGPGNSVGHPLPGTNVWICLPRPEDADGDQGGGDEAALVHAERDAGSSGPTMGEVVISGAQVDAMSSYLNSAELTSRVFVQCRGEGGCLGKDFYYYRTGDLGCIDPTTGELRILGRIKDGMVKINGMRIELSEIENACIDDASDDGGGLVMDCIAAVVNGPSSSGDDSAHRHNQLIAYCLLSSASLSELGAAFDQQTAGVIVAPGPLLSLLRARCDRRVRRGCTPSFFVLINRIPLSPTGKRCRSSLPPLSGCSIMNSSANSNERKSLWECGKVGLIVAKKICECLNLQPCQRQLVTLGKPTYFFAFCEFAIPH
jgi:acyl-CoA synthetase (AMP-forming)/AMP-acid ligase II